MLELTIYTEPVAKGRPRFGYGRVFTPVKSRRFEALIAKAMREHWERPAIKKAMRVTFLFYYNTKRKHQQGLYKMTKPDIDNLIKSIFDAGNDIIWQDDNQIVEIESYKKWTKDASHIYIQIQEA